MTLLTGFLGSGKTTLLNAVLKAPALRDTAVIVNEFGSVAIDHDLILRGEEQYLVTSTGCLCCQAGSDIRSSLFALTELDGTVAPRFSRVIVETTGLADPAPIVNSLLPGASASGLRDHVVARRFRLAGILATCDGMLGETALDKHIECWKQLAFADRVVLTKTDLVEESRRDQAVATLTERIRTLNPTAQIIDRRNPALALDALCADGSFLSTDKTEDVPGWLALERMLAAEGHNHDHDPDRHGDRVRAVPLVATAPLEPGLLDAFLTLMTSRPGILRLKGIVALADDPERPMVIQGVQHVLHEKTRLERWPSGDRRSRIVVIGEDLSPKAMRELFSVVSATPRWLRRGRRVA